MIESCITALKLNTYRDNYDSERFSYDGVDRSQQFIPRERVFWFNWFIKNVESIHEAIESLEDEPSKELMRAIIAFRLAGHHSARIPVDFQESGERWESYTELEKFVPSSIPTAGMFGKLRHYNFEFDGKHFVCDCLGLKYYLFRRQYFLERGHLKIQPDDEDFVVDAGAYLGDTAVVFGKAVGIGRHVYAFDPVQEHIDVITINTKQNPDCNITPMPYGLSDKDITCAPIILNTYAPGFSSNNGEVPLRALDSLVMEGSIRKVDFIKMDIEGAELAALKGAIGTIRRFKPKLAISLYHKPDDLFEIPRFIRDYFPDYKMYIGHYTIHNEETVLYCQIT